MAIDFTFWGGLNLLDSEQHKELYSELEALKVADLEKIQTLFFTVLPNGLTHFHDLMHQVLFLNHTQRREVFKKIQNYIIPRFHPDDSIDVDLIRQLLDSTLPHNRALLTNMVCEYINYLFEKYIDNPEKTYQLSEQLFIKHNQAISVFQILLLNTLKNEHWNQSERMRNDLTHLSHLLFEQFKGVQHSSTETVDDFFKILKNHPDAIALLLNSPNTQKDFLSLLSKTFTKKVGTKLLYTSYIQGAIFPHLSNYDFLNALPESFLVDCFKLSPLKFLQSCGPDASVLNNQEMKAATKNLNIDDKISLFSYIALNKEVDSSVRESSDTFINVLAHSLISDILKQKDPEKTHLILQALSEMNPDNQKKLSKSIQNYLDKNIIIDIKTFNLNSISTVLNKVCFGNERDYAFRKVSYQATLMKSVLKQLFDVSRPFDAQFLEKVDILFKLTHQTMLQPFSLNKLRKTFFGENIEKMVNLTFSADHEQAEKAWLMLLNCKDIPIIKALIEDVYNSPQGSASISVDNESDRISIWEERASMLSRRSSSTASSPAPCSVSTEDIWSEDDEEEQMLAETRSRSPKIYSTDDLPTAAKTFGQLTTENMKLLTKTDDELDSNEDESEGEHHGLS